MKTFEKVTDFIFALLCAVGFAITALAVVLLAVALTAEAKADTFVNVNVAAYHYDRAAVAERGFNEHNLGAGLEFTKDDVGAMVGEYTNSMRRTSWYALGKYTPIHAGVFSFGVVAGGVTGYLLAPVTPVFGAIATAQWQRVGVSIVLTPSMPEKDTYGFAGLQLRFKL
jgi:hypothetical protein